MLKWKSLSFVQMVHQSDLRSIIITYMGFYAKQIKETNGTSEHYQDERKSGFYGSELGRLRAMFVEMLS